MRTLTTLRSTAAALALCTTAGLGTAVAATATPTADAAPAASAAARPTLEVPFICGQVWVGATYTDHRPTNAIDFNLSTGGDSDLGKWIQASNGGRVTFAGNKGSGYGNTVDIYHANGWSTRYAHLQEIAVDEGQMVTATTGIGRVGKSGGQSSAHLHYEQRKDNAAQVIYFGDTKAKYWGKTSYARRTLC